MSIWNTLLLYPLINLLIFCYQAVGGNLGIAIIVVTVLVRLFLLPLMLPSMRSAKKMQELKPELDNLAKKFGKDKQRLAQEQIALYKKYNINPASGLLPMIIQFLVIIALYQAFNRVIATSQAANEINDFLYSFIKLPENVNINTKFLYLDLTQPDRISLPNPINLGPIKISFLPGILLILSAVFQYFSSNMIAPVNKNTPKKEDDMANAMQNQMRLMMPLMTILIGISFPSGLVIYWLTYSIFIIVQQYYLKKSKEDK